MPEFQGRPRPLGRVAILVSRYHERVTSRLLDGAEALAQAVADASDDLDERIARAAVHWKIERIGLPERLAMRIGAYELIHGDVPPKVAIDEALWLTRRFAGEHAVGFVNGILDRIGHESGRL